MSDYHLHDIFSSLQGEGRNSGRPATFIRFSSCNLACAWCDTHKSERMALSCSKILEKVKLLGNKSVIITGGEPTIQPHLEKLLQTLKDEGFWLALETNGVNNPDYLNLFDYIAVSPKPQYYVRYVPNLMLRNASEVRIVAINDTIVNFCDTMRNLIRAENYYISPLEENNKIHYGRAMKLLNKLNAQNPNLMPPWSLSIQMHKVLGIR